MITTNLSGTRLRGILSILFIAVSVVCGAGQTLTFSQHIAPIIFKNCAPCHREGGIAPFTLTSYEDVSKRGKMIELVTQKRYMPPWKADREFQRYIGERGLSDGEIAQIKTWVDTGMKKGKKVKKPTFEDSEVVRTPDLVIEMNEPFPVSDKGEDDYRFFNVPSNVPYDTVIASIEFVPGNKRVVHHSKIMTDTSHMVRSIDGLSANDSKIREFDKYPPLDRFFYGWVPGNFRFDFPKGTGKKLYKETDFIMNIHYAPNARANQSDQSKLNIYYAKEKVEREVYNLTIEETSISNPPFLIKANTAPTFYASFGPIPIDISAIAVLPHMHYLGKTFKAFAVLPDGDFIPLVKIDNWDFRWQSTYQFQKMLHIPKNSVILIEATYDNTSENPENQFNPPKDITYGWNSTSEMMNLILYYLIYKEGDENLTTD